MAKDIPIIERNKTIEIPQIPDIQGAYTQVAASDNLMSTIGSTVAQNASNAMAQQLGYEAGKHPTNKFYPTFTEFDKNFAESYKQQANATLTVQANKLLEETHVEMSKAKRLTPQLIANADKQLQVGINQILSNAPPQLKPQLESSLKSQSIRQITTYKEKMFEQQRIDQKNTTDNAISINNKSILELSSSGDLYGAHQALKNNIAMIDNAIANHDYTPEQGRTLKETAKQNYLNGRTGFEYDVNNRGGKGEQFLKGYATTKPDDMTHDQHFKSGQYLEQQVNFNNTLKAQDENLKAQQMLNSIATNVNAITDTQWQDFERSVSHQKAEHVKFSFIQAWKANKNASDTQDKLIRNWGDAREQANASADVKNNSFNRLVNYQMQQGKNQGKPISQDMAEVDVASSAGSTIPVFTQTLKDRIWSGDPRQMDAGVQQVNTLKALHAGHALMGLNDSDNAMYAQYEALRNPADPTVGARLVAENRENLDPAVLKVTQGKWQTLVDDNTRLAKQDVDDWVLKKFGLRKEPSFFHPFSDSFDSPFMATHYSADILNKYKTFYEATRGNDVIATKMTQEYVANNYGDSYINGSKALTLHPIEKTIGFGPGEGIPAIHADMVRQLSNSLVKNKEAYDNGAYNEYWTIDQPKTKGGALQMTKHERAELGTKTSTYDMALIGNNFDQWDVNINTAYGPRSLFLEAPSLGVTTYSPNREWIKDENMGKAHKEPSNINPDIITKNVVENKNPGIVSKAISAVGEFLIPSAHAITKVRSKDIDTSKFQYLKEKEGLIGSHGKPALKAYRPLPGDKLTYGWGNTTGLNGKGIKEGDVITEKQAEQLFTKDVRGSLHVIAMKAKVPFNAHQVEALVSFGHHLGENNLRKMVRFLNNKPTEEAIRKKWSSYNKYHKKVMKSFKTRRKEELNIFFRE